MIAYKSTSEEKKNTQSFEYHFWILSYPWITVLWRPDEANEVEDREKRVLFNQDKLVFCREKAESEAEKK